ncbi:McrC family protein [Nocardiopsis suaedae]|uniref:Restriction endonuclease n=1 Tax=Nocardiopsis suaedae TaxID=3018444 RepID=A0ABT4TLT8_9ACTN|nr:hypothetical protein [Nocardiopsis suaedae]MDA2805062.1 hypothetical protein [Nocardiopsis suaedae]
MSEDPLVISLKEREKPRPVHLTPGEASALEEFSDRFLSGNAKVVKMKRSSPTEWEVEAATCIGAVRIPVPGGRPIHLHIHPKLSIHRILMLLGHDSEAWDVHTIPLPETQPLLPAMAEAFARSYKRANGGAPLRDYRTTKEEATVLRGRILPEEQTRRRGSLATPIIGEHDDFTVVLPENRVLLTAARRLASLPGVSRSTSSFLRGIEEDLSELVPLAPDEPFPQWKPSSRNRGFEPVLHLAETILRGDSANHEGRGQVPVDGFLFNPETFFEKFIDARIDERLGPGRKTKAQDRSHRLDHLGRVTLRPDTVVYESGRPVAVVDAKYKDLDSKGNPAKNDLYQMVAYCAALGVTSGHLVYAFGDVAKGHEEYFVEASGITVHIHSVELSGTREEIASRFTSLLHALPATAS